MGRINPRNKQPVDTSTGFQEYVRTGPTIDIVTKSDEEIEEIRKELLQMPEGEQKSTALRRFYRYMEERQELLNLGGGKLPFTDDRQ